MNKLNDNQLRAVLYLYGVAQLDIDRLLSIPMKPARQGFMSIWHGRVMPQSECGMVAVRELLLDAFGLDDSWTNDEISVVLYKYKSELMSKDRYKSLIFDN